MATTTNYSWSTPDDTALVKDGAAAIRSLGTSIDTTTKALNPSTTLGDIEYRSSSANTNTRLPIGTTGQVLAVVGGVPAWATTADQTPLTTKGDLFTFDTADARLPVGTNGHILVADSATATGLAWAAPAAGTPANATATVATNQSTTSSTYTDLTTAGPAVTVTTGTKALVIISSEFQNGAAAGTFYMSAAVSGATTLAANDARAIKYYIGAATNQQITMTQAFIYTGLTAGSNTFTCKYRAPSTTGYYENRYISVVDMGS
jgi:hypothetical protein